MTFSGDKLLGGPQAGIIVGDEDLVGRLAKHALARALRVDGPTLAGLAATLEAYLNGEAVTLPFWRMATLPEEEIRSRAEALADSLSGEVAPGESAIGAGSVPGITIPTTLVVFPGEDHLYERLLGFDPPIVARREAGSLVMDLRTVDARHDATIREAVSECR